MTFFPPPPPPPEEPSGPQPTGWRPPAWDRPSEAVLGAVVPATLLLARTDEHALALDEIRAYPNGFVCRLVILRNPMAPRDLAERFGPMRMHPMMLRGPRLGFEFSDGSVARTDQPGRPPQFGGNSVELVTVSHAPGRNPFGVATDDDGIPVAPVLVQRGGGGGGERYEVQFWCFPLPPPGPMTIHADWPEQDVAEVSIPFDADLIRDAAATAVTIWEPDE
jgi:hypothetical protein